MGTNMNTGHAERDPRNDSLGGIPMERADMLDPLSPEPNVAAAFLPSDEEVSREVEAVLSDPMRLWRAILPEVAKGLSNGMREKMDARLSVAEKVDEDLLARLGMCLSLLGSKQPSGCEASGALSRQGAPSGDNTMEADTGDPDRLHKVEHEASKAAITMPLDEQPSLELEEMDGQIKEAKRDAHAAGSNGSEPAQGKRPSAPATVKSRKRVISPNTVAIDTEALRSHADIVASCEYAASVAARLSSLESEAAILRDAVRIIEGRMPSPAAPHLGGGSNACEMTAGAPAWPPATGVNFCSDAATGDAEGG